MRNLAAAAALLGLPLLHSCNDGGGSPPTPPAPTPTPTVTFETRSELSAGAGVSDGVVADVTGDGTVDMLLAGVDGVVRLLVGDPAGTFSPGGEVTIGGAGQVTVLAAADLDGDGDTDVVAVRAGTSSAVSLLNTGDGTLIAGPETLVPSSPTGVLVGDFQGDNIPDLVVSSFSNSGVQVFAGVGDGAFSQVPIQALGTGVATVGLAMGDVDGDDDAEVVVCDRDNNRLLISAGVGSAPIVVPIGSQPVSVAFGDATADGAPDLAVSCFGSQAVEIVSFVNGSYEVVSTVPTLGRPAGLTLTDINNDSVQDLLVSLLSNSCINILVGARDGSFSSEEQFATTGMPIRAITEDVDQDGRHELFVISSGTDKVNLYRGQEDGPSGARMLEPSLEDQPASWVATGDFDRDGRNEIATASFAARMLSVLDIETDEAGRPQVVGTTQIDLEREIMNMISADVDQDGVMDLVLCVRGVSGGGVIVLRNVTAPGAEMGFERFPEDRNFVLVTGQLPTDVLVADVTGDGANDIVAAFTGDLLVRIVPQAAPGLVFTDPINVPTEAAPLGLASGDFDGDGQIEVGFSQFDQARVRIIGPTGPASWDVEMDIAVGQVPNYLRAADVNSDGRVDLMVSNNLSDSVSLLVALPTGGFGISDFEAGPNPTALLAEDLDFDGDVDILVASLTGYQFRVLLGDGEGSFMQGTVFPGVYTASAAALADLTGNGVADLAVASILHRRLAVFRNTTVR